MADLNKNIELNFNTNADKAKGEIDGLKNSIKELNDNTVKATQSTNANTQSLNNTKDALKAGKSAADTLSNGFKGVGLAIKAMGIGLFLEAFQVVKDLFKQNSTVANGFATATKALAIVFNDLVEFITNSIGPVTDFFKSLIDNPQAKLKQFGDAIKDNLIERFNSFVDTLGYVGQGLKNLFTGDFNKAIDSFKKAGKESIDVFTGVNNTADKVVDGVNNLGKAIGDYANKVWDSAAAQVAAENAAKIGAATAKKRIEDYDREAEKLRQQRDNTNLSLAERKKASDELAKVLDKEAKELSNLANLTVQAAQNNLALNNSTENRVALIEAQTEAAGYLAQVEGFRSEQQAGALALDKEQLAINQLIIDSTNNRAISQKQFDESLEKDNVKRLENQRANLEAELKLQEESLIKKRDGYVRGTVEWETANQDLLNKQQELNNKLTQNSIDTDNTIRENKIATNQLTIDNEKLSFEQRLATLDEQEALIKEKQYANDAERIAALKAVSDQRLEIERAEAEQKLAIQNQNIDSTIAGVGVLKSIFEKNKGVQKGLIVAESALGIAKIIINTQAANARAAAELGPYVAPPYIVANNISAGVGIAANIAATAKALSALGGGGGAGGGNSAKNASGPAPSVSFVASSENQIGNTINAQQQEAAPVRAFVVSSDVTTAQSLDRNLVTSTSLG